MTIINYKQFRSSLVLKGFIIRGGEESMVLFTPRARYEINKVDGEYKTYDFTNDENIPTLNSLEAIYAFTTMGIEKADLYSWYSADWRVSHKGHTLYIVGQMVDEGSAVKEDLAMALQVCEDMRYLILMSDYIPDEMKAGLTKDVATIKDEFARILKNMN